MFIALLYTHTDEIYARFYTTLLIKFSYKHACRYTFLSPLAVFWYSFISFETNIKNIKHVL